MGDCGLAQQVGTFSNGADDLHTGGILPVVYSRDWSATWSTSVHSIRQGFQVYDTLLKEFPKGYGYTVDDGHCVSYTNRWSVGEDHRGFRGHVVSMRPGS